ncbi:hypothetical protein SCP_0403540 [Sparassis crispa]|uniref:CxC2-like cysteine cluster KDZ transposase-associated domain-containing protein n=1 Tax=Sparassis crispa TaxID=139825 RepID=A0A401GIJ5_9APHY|nr:hypothetical protein SCP_0403540 [Sparassis crispa]GBE81978.1 hypothetical protein SCP_0403540 [Sparassis crispa]
MSGHSGKTKGKHKVSQLYVHVLEPPSMSRTMSISNDGRQVKTRTSQHHLPSEMSTSISPQDESPDAPVPPPEVEGTEGLEDVDIVATTRVKCYRNSDEPLLNWMPYRDEYLDECLCQEGRGEQRGRAVACIVLSHAANPLHAIEQWTDSKFFAKTSLCDLGLRVQLGHPFSQHCPIKTAGHRDFLVLHVNGIHRIAVNFCDCQSIPHHIQLLRAGWWPAMPKEPQTCATFSLLRPFHLLNLQGKVTAYDFYRALEALTDNTGLTTPPDRLPSFMHIVREWRHIKALKCAGHRHDPSGVEGTKDGELTVPCRACPHPGINLPDGREQAPPEKSWLYRLIIGMDANFQLKNRDRSSAHREPPLGPGWAYFVKEDGYHEHIKKHVNDEEISTCTGFQAIMLANLKRAKGLHVTGVSGISCSRHEMFRANGMGDLQQGER